MTTHETCKSNVWPTKEICLKSSVVYMATCTLCKDAWVHRHDCQTLARSSTGALASNIIRKGSSTSALGDHYAKKHEEKPASVTFSLLKHAHNHDVLRLHIKEAIAIKTYCQELNRSPELIDHLRKDVIQHTRTHFPNIPGSKSMWTFRWIGREGR